MSSCSLNQCCYTAIIITVCPVFTVQSVCVHEFRSYLNFVCIRICTFEGKLFNNCRILTGVEQQLQEKTGNKRFTGHLHFFGLHGRHFSPTRGIKKYLKQLIPVSCCLHEMPLTMANPLLLAVEEATTKPTFKN